MTENNVGLKIFYVILFTIILFGVGMMFYGLWLIDYDSGKGLVTADIGLGIFAISSVLFVAPSGESEEDDPPNENGEKLLPIFCTYCGSEQNMEVDMLYCGNCGVKLEGE